MIGLALQHKMSLEQWVKDEYDGDETFNTPKTVKCYKESKITKVITSTGSEVVSKANYFSIEKVTERDRIDGSDVLSVEEFDMLGCKYYRSYV